MKCNKWTQHYKKYLMLESCIILEHSVFKNLATVCIFMLEITQSHKDDVVNCLISCTIKSDSKLWQDHRASCENSCRNIIMNENLTVDPECEFSKKIQLNYFVQRQSSWKVGFLRKKLIWQSKSCYQLLVIIIIRFKDSKIFWSLLWLNQYSINLMYQFMELKCDLLFSLAQNGLDAQRSLPPQGNYIIISTTWTCNPGHLRYT